MKIIMDFRKYDGVVGGVEQGAIQVSRGVCERGGEVVLVCKERRREQTEEIFGGLQGLKIVTVPVKSHVMSSENAQLDSGFFQDLAEKEKVDVIHFFYNWSFPQNRKVPCILTVHDVIPFTFREAMPLFRNLFVYKPAIRKACKLNDAIATVSEYSRQDIHKKVGAPLEKIRVIPNGLRTPDKPDPEVEAELNGKFGLKDGFVLNVGGIHERKNIPRLIQSFARLVKEHGYQGKLIITGSVSGAPYQEKMKKICDAAVASSGVGDRIIFTGFITEKQLDILLTRADVFVYPSLYEGFGIPILEAMKVDTPVVTSNVTAMPEVADGAAELVDPLDVGAMANAMSRVITDEALRAKLIEAGRKQAEPYSWAASCEMYIRFYEEMVAKGI